MAEVLNVDIDELVKSKDDKQENNLLTNESNVENNKNSNGLIDVSNVWGEIKLHLLDYNISQISYDIWFEPIVDAKQNNTEFIIYSEDEIVVRHINEYYKDILIKAIQTHYSQDIKEVKIEQIVKKLSQ